MNDKVYEKYESLVVSLGTDELCKALVKAIGTYRLEEYLDYIARCYDLEEDYEN